jgi:hypothetical protein
MLRKAVWVALFVAVPGFLGYPAALNVDPSDKKPRPALDGGALENVPLPTTAVISLEPRWLVIQGSATDGRAHHGEFLTKELQRQLRQVGCYGGEINGVWTQSTRRAMQIFINRVNALLPVERPDHVLLAILQKHPDKACNKPCPLAEIPAADGRCVPGALGALSIKTATLPEAGSLITSWTATETAALDDAIPQLPASKPSRALLSAPVKPPAKLAVPPKPVPQRPIVATVNREQARHLQRSERISQRAERPPHQAAFVRSMFQRFDSSLR